MERNRRRKCENCQRSKALHQLFDIYWTHPSLREGVWCLYCEECTQAFLGFLKDAYPGGEAQLAFHTP